MNNKLYRIIFYAVVIFDLALAALLIALMFCVQKHTSVVTSPLSPLVAIAKTATPKPTPHTQGNLLYNPGFEGDFVNCGGACNVAAGWTPWTSETLTPPCIAGEPDCYIPCPSNCADCTVDYGCWWKRAEHKAATLQFPERVHSGTSAQQAFTFGGMGEYGVYQQVGVPLGAELALSGYAQGWQQCWPAQQGNCPQAKMNLRLGIDPYGGTDPYSANVIWSAAVESFDEYAPISISTIARAITATVFTYARPEWDWARMNNDAYWDDLALVAVQSATPTPSATPEPTATQGPIVAQGYLPCILRNWLEAPKPTYTPTPTPEPSATPVVTSNVLLLLPPQSVIEQSESITISAYVKARFQAVELRLFYSPTALSFVEMTGTLPCSITTMRQQPGVISYDCEMAGEVSVDATVLAMQFTGGMTGTTNVEVYANGAFIGLENGYGLWLVGEGAKVRVK